MAVRQNYRGPVETVRIITNRLSTASPKALPHIAAQVSGQLWQSRDVLSTAASSKQGSEASNAAHRFRTYLSTLLQDRTVEGRWAAVVLVKSAIEAGGMEMLSKSNGWVRNLLGILKRPDPSTTRTLATIALTRIFMLTWDHANLVREITTPALPGFVSTCVSNAENQRCSPNELLTILEAFATLLPRHPTIFRTNETQIRSLLMRILSGGSSAGSGRQFTNSNKDAARQVLVLLHHCSPKQGAAEKWDETLATTIKAGHEICNRLFRSVIEDWQATSVVTPRGTTQAMMQGEVGTDDIDALGLPGWRGIFAGSQRLTTLLEILDSHIHAATSSTVTVRLGLLVELISRLLNLRLPSAGDGSATANHQMSRDERETLYSVLPGIHISALNLREGIVRRFGKAAVSVVQPVLGQVTWLFAAKGAEIDVRSAVYSLLSSILELQGPSLSKADVAEIEPIIKACCQDLLPSGQATQIVAATGAGDLGSQSNKQICSHPTVHESLGASAERLLTLCFSKLAPSHLPARLRALMERIAVLGNHKDALVACVLNPVVSSNASKVQPSLLPLLARQHGADEAAEAIIRPRMPVIKSGRSTSGGHDIDEDEYSMNGLDDDHDHDPDVQTDDPTDDLMAALAQQDAGADEEDLYNSSPHPMNGTTSVEDQQANKRKGDDLDPADALSKRQKASSAATSLFETADPMIGPFGVPVTVVTQQPLSSFVTAPQLSQKEAATTLTTTRASADSAPDAGSDDSDFDIPPLTMEQSDVEDEDDEDDEE